MSKDQDHRATATHILSTANKVVTTERGGQHGGAEDSFQMIATFWATYLANTPANFGTPNTGALVVTPKDVAQMMVLLKIARNAHGQLKEDDFVDQAGYTGLAAALAGIKSPEPYVPQGIKTSPAPRPAPPTPPAAPYTPPPSVPVTKSTVVEPKPEQDDGTIGHVLRQLDKDITA